MNLRFDGASRTFAAVSVTQNAARLARAYNNGMAVRPYGNPSVRDCEAAAS
jgi:hypothetical protein